MTAQATLARREGHVEPQRSAVKGGAVSSAVGAPRARPVVAIALGSAEDRRRLAEILGVLHADVRVHESLRTLRRSLSRDQVNLVITDVTLPDGNWADVLRLTIQASPHPSILVHSDVVSDRLWSEILWRGAYDMLIAPYSAEDARQVIEGALRSGCLLDGPASSGLRA